MGRNHFLSAFISFAFVMTACSEGRDNNTTVVAIAPSIAILAQPSDVSVGQSIPDIQVAVLTSQGLIDSRDNSTQITLSLVTDPSAGAAQLQGQVVHTVTQGRAVFSGLSLDIAASGYRFQAVTNTGLTPVISQSFDVTAAAAPRLRFVTLPGQALAKTRRLTVDVEILNAQGQRDTADNSSLVTLNIRNDPNGGRASLLGTRSRAVSAGLASFPALGIDCSGRGFTLAATSPGLALEESVAFSINPRSDFNGDGIADLFVGAARNGGNNRGAVYIYYGGLGLTGSQPASSADVVIEGANGDLFGSELAEIGDFNGDGFADILVGALGNSTNGPSSGGAYVFLGSANPAPVLTVSDAALTVLGDVDDDFVAESLSNLGDFNGDGFDDFVLAAEGADNGAGQRAGAALVFFGSSNPQGTRLGSSADVIFGGVSNNDFFADGVGGGGDVNGDGFPDLVIGASSVNMPGVQDSGEAYVFFGSSQLPAVVSASNADMTILGQNEFSAFGQEVRIIPDINGDGLDDFVIGSVCEPVTGNGRPGVAFLFYGSNQPVAVRSSADADVTLAGLNDNDSFSTKILGLGDISGDGIGDFVIVANANGASFSGAGAVYLFYGGASLPSMISPTSAEATFLGTNQNSLLGAIGQPFDFDDDGRLDLVLGAISGHDDGGQRTGALYLFSDFTGLTGTRSVGTSDLKISGENLNDQFGRALGSGR